MPTDSVIVHYSGTWASYSGAFAAGALLTVYDSGTSNLASIFTNSTLATPSDNPITADANGLLPFAWIGSSAYKVRLTTAGGTLIDEQDVIDGAIDTDLFTAADFAKPDQDMNAKTANHTVVSDDLGEIINCDCTGGAFDITLISAVTATNGRGVTIRHVGTANTVGVVTVSSQTITSPTTGVTTTSLELIGYGESVTLESDGANWHVTRYVPPLLRPNTPGVILIADRVSAAPSSSPGTRYIVAAAFSTFEQEDIIEDNGQGGFIEITPPTDCGWIAYVQDEDAYYCFKGSAWVAFGAALQVFTGSGTYTPTTGMTHCLVISTGSGGGGGGADGDGDSTAGGGGGGAGATCVELFAAATIGVSQTVTIGAAGAAGADTGGNGGAGGDTTFGALHTAGGGSGGNGATTTVSGGATGAAGGTGTGGTANISGGGGGSGFSDNDSNTAISGAGGGSFWGGGGPGRYAAAAPSVAGVAGAAYGSGGSGAVCVDTTTGAAGGAGAAGAVVVLEFIA